MIFRAGWFGCFLIVGGAAGAQGTAAAPKYGDDKSVVIPYTEKADFQHLDSPLHVRAQINGGPVGEFTVDTGSVGVIVAADEVPGIDPKAPEGSITYSSSGVSLKGVWTKATVAFPDAHGGVATAVVPVLAVTSETCTGEGVNAAHCHALAHPHPHMMGVGFGRGQGSGHPEKNVFLNLKEMQAGEMRRGYVIAPEGITLGLTGQVVGTGFVWQKLVERPVSPDTAAFGATLKDWNTAVGSFKVGAAQAGPGIVLMDTGLTNMMLAEPGGLKGDVPDGTPVTVELLGGQVEYTFNVGDANNAQTPRRVSWVVPTHGVYVNTGLRALAKYEYLFDSDGGWLGLRPLKP